MKNSKIKKGTKNSIEKINNWSGEYGKDFMKIKFNSDDNLALNKTLKIHNKTIVIRFVLKKMVNIIHSFFRWIFVWIINAGIW